MRVELLKNFSVPSVWPKLLFAACRAVNSNTCLNLIASHINVT